MDALLHILVRILTILFGIGVVGCLIVAWKFFSVLLEKGDSETTGESSAAKSR
jgi:hypothetical protein